MDDKAPSEWYYAVGDHQQGPVALDRLIEQIRAGAIPADAWVWHEGLASWVLLSSLDELARHLPSGIPFGPTGAGQSRSLPRFETPAAAGPPPA